MTAKQADPVTALAEALHQNEVNEPMKQPPDCVCPDRAEDVAERLAAAGFAIVNRDAVRDALRNLYRSIPQDMIEKDATEIFAAIAAIATS